MMKNNYLVLLAITIIFTVYSACMVEEICPSEQELGFLEWSKETEEWFPSSYQNTNSSLEFESENGETVKFTTSHSYHLKGTAESVDIICEDELGTTKVQWFNSRYTGAFEAGDSLEINFGFGVWNEKLASNNIVEADFYEWILLSMNTANSGMGRIRIITDMRNAELSDIDHSPETFILKKDFVFMGKEYEEIYCADHNRIENLFLEKGKGIIGYVDSQGVSWKLK